MARIFELSRRAAKECRTPKEPDPWQPFTDRNSESRRAFIELAGGAKSLDANYGIGMWKVR